MMVIIKGMVWSLKLCLPQQPLLILEMLVSEIINNAHLMFSSHICPPSAIPCVHPGLNKQQGTALWFEQLCVCACECTLVPKKKGKD